MTSINILMKKLIKRLLQELGYEIRKKTLDFSPVIEAPDLGYFVSNENDLDYYSTPAGNYFIPVHAPNDVVLNCMKAGVYFEPEVIAIARKLIKRGTVVLDVGSNFGQMAILFSKLVGEDGLVYAFEADDYVFEVLKKNIAANNCKNVIPVFGAVHNEAGKELIFPKQDFVQFDAYGSYGIDPTAESGRKVRSIKIDDIEFIKPVSFMKVDVQGSDFFAMEGARETVLHHKMPILFEFEQQFQEQFGTTFQNYVSFVNEVDYKFDEIIMEINYLVSPKLIIV